jgi:hypothetical protein
MLIPHLDPKILKTHWDFQLPKWKLFGIDGASSVMGMKITKTKGFQRT